MVSRSAKVGQAFGSKGVLSKATAAVVEEVGGGGVEEASNDSAALGTGTAGALKFATNRKTLHMYDGTEWDRIAGGTDAAPVITEDAPTVSVAATATDSSRVNFKVTDPEGFPISYSISYMRDNDRVFFGNESSNMPPFLAHPAIITKADSGRATYRFITRQTESDGSGNSTTDLFKARYFGTDGARHAVSTKDFQLSFKTDFDFSSSPNANSSVSWAGSDINYVSPYVSASTGTARSSNNVSPGKGYLEYKVRQTASYMMLGLGWSNYNGGYSSATSTYVYSSGGTRYPGGYSLAGMGSFGLNDIIMVAYDTAPTDTGDYGGSASVPRVWWGKNGSWATRTPGTDVGYPFTIPDNTTPTNWDTTNQFLRPVFHYGGGSAANYRIEIISHTQGAQYTIPTGWSLA